MNDGLWSESPEQFESRKADHIKLALNEKNEAVGFSGLDQVRLIHEAIPEINFSDISLSQKSLTLDLKTPFLVSSMTAGHRDSLNLNETLARACEARGWMMGVGSQRRELDDSRARDEWKKVRRRAPRARLLGNLGLSQLISTPIEKVMTLIDSLEASAMIIHTNPLQEALQPEGTPTFKGGIEALRELCDHSPVPVILKETGCGFSKPTLEKLADIGLAAVDVSGYGGTHWGRIEGDRSPDLSQKQMAADVFSGWGVSTFQSLFNAQDFKSDFEIWASGGIRNGLDAAKTIAMGSKIVGFAKPALQAALSGQETLEQWMSQIEFELKVALFCTGSLTVTELSEKKAWVKS